MSEFFRSRLDTAHALIDEYNYTDSIEIIKNLKTRIHDQDISTKINIHDSDVEKEYQARYEGICRKQGDPYKQYNDLMLLNRWRAQEYLKYYDKILRENDIQ